MAKAKKAVEKVVKKATTKKVGIEIAATKKKVLKGVKKVLGKIPAKYLDTWNPNKIVTTRKTGIYADTWSPEKTNRGKTGMYLDTWLPEGVDGKTAQLYADTWVPTTKISKGVKTGLYADVWVPAYASLKMKNKK